MKLIFFSTIIVLVGCTNHKIERLNKVAKELLEIKEITDFHSNRNSSINDVVNIGPNLYEILSTRKTPIEHINIVILRGDFFEGNLGVTHSILFQTKDSRLGIRMRYDWKIDKFHIIGFSGYFEEEQKSNIMIRMSEL